MASCTPTPVCLSSIGLPRARAARLPWGIARLSASCRPGEPGRPQAERARGLRPCRGVTQAGQEEQRGGAVCDSRVTFLETPSQTPEPCLIGVPPAARRLMHKRSHYICPRLQAHGCVWAAERGPPSSPLPLAPRPRHVPCRRLPQAPSQRTLLLTSSHGIQGPDMLMLFLQAQLLLSLTSKL